MKYSDILKLDAEHTNNTTYYELMYSTVTPEDIEGGCDPELFATYELIIWCVKNKKYVEYYDKVNSLDSTHSRHTWLESLIDMKTVIHNGGLQFGLYIELVDNESFIKLPGATIMEYRRL